MIPPIENVPTSLVDWGSLVTIIDDTLLPRDPNDDDNEDDGDDEDDEDDQRHNNESHDEDDEDDDDEPAVITETPHPPRRSPRKHHEGAGPASLGDNSVPFIKLSR